MNFTARIATESNGFIAAAFQTYGEGAIYWTDSNMNPLKTASIEEWMWAVTVWDNPVEKGSWIIEVEDTYKFNDWSAHSTKPRELLVDKGAKWTERHLKLSDGRESHRNPLIAQVKGYCTETYMIQFVKKGSNVDVIAVDICNQSLEGHDPYVLSSFTQTSVSEDIIATCDWEQCLEEAEKAVKSFWLDDSKWEDQDNLWFDLLFLGDSWEFEQKLNSGELTW